MQHVGAERAIQVLAKPSDHIVAYFENTEGSVEGVNEAHYSNKVVVQEIGASAKRTAANYDRLTRSAWLLLFACCRKYGVGPSLSTLGLILTP